MKECVPEHCNEYYFMFIYLTMFNMIYNCSVGCSFVNNSVLIHLGDILYCKNYCYYYYLPLERSYHESKREGHLQVGLIMKLENQWH